MHFSVQVFMLESDVNGAMSGRRILNTDCLLPILLLQNNKNLEVTIILPNDEL